jgi:hypothetical protein
MDGHFLLFLAGIHTTPDAYVQGLADTGHVLDAMAPYASGQRYLNFAGHTVDASAGFEARAWDRLREVRPRWIRTGVRS